MTPQTEEAIRKVLEALDGAFVIWLHDGPHQASLHGMQRDAVQLALIALVESIHK